MWVFYYKKRCLSLTYVLVAAIAEVTTRRRYKVIHIEVAAIADLNVVFPGTAVVFIVITNFTSHDTFFLSWVFTIQPSGSDGAAASGGNALFWYLVTSLPHHTIPAIEVVSTFPIAFHCALVGKTHCTIGLVQFLVGLAFFTCKHKNLAFVKFTCMNRKGDIKK